MPLIEPFEPRQHLTATPLVQNDAIDWSVTSGDVIYYTERVPTARQPDRVRLHRYRISDKSDVLIESPDGPTWRKIENPTLGSERLFFTGTSVDLRALFSADRDSSDLVGITGRKIQLRSEQIATSRQGGVYFLASDRQFGQEMYYAAGDTSGEVTRLTDVQAGARWSNLSFPSASSQGSVHFVDHNANTIYRTNGADRNTRQIHAGGGAIDILGYARGQMAFVDASDQKLYVIGGTGGANRIEGDYVVAEDLRSELVSLGTSDFAFSAASASRGNEFWRIDFENFAAIPMPELTPGPDDGFDVLFNSFSAFGDNAAVINLFNNGEPLTRVVSADRVATTRWSGFTDALYAVGQRIFVDGDGNLFRSSDLRSKDKLLDTGVITVESSNDRLIVRKREGIYLGTPKDPLTS